MFEKNTVIDLWDAFGKVPTREAENGAQVIDDPKGFLGWPDGTDIETVWRWFDEAFEEWGGVYTLLYECPPKERRFFVNTPDGVIECYAKHEGVDSQCDYPGVYVDLRSTNEQKSGKTIGDLVCCVEYDNAHERIQVVPYADLTIDEPSFGEMCDYDSAVIVVTGYGDSIKL